MTLSEFFNKFLTVNLIDYENINIDLPISTLLFAFFAGLILATVVINYKKAAIHLVLRKLMRVEAFSEESAKTLDELGINNFASRLAVQDKSRAGKIIHRVGEVKYTYEEYMSLIKSKDYKEEKIDFSTAKFYIPNDEDSSENSPIERAKKITDSPAPSLVSTILICILLFSILVCTILVLPNILNIINNSLGN